MNDNFPFVARRGEASSGNPLDIDQYLGDLVILEEVLAAMAGRYNSIQSGISLRSIVNVDFPTDKPDKLVSIDLLKSGISVTSEVFVSSSRLGLRHLLDIWTVHFAIEHVTLNNVKQDFFVEVDLSSVANANFIGFIGENLQEDGDFCQIVLVIIINQVDVDDSKLRDFLSFAKKINIRIAFQFLNMKNSLIPEIVEHCPEYIIVPFDKYSYFKHDRSTKELYERIFMYARCGKVRIIASSVHSDNLSGLAYASRVVLQQGSYWDLSSDRIICPGDDFSTIPEVLKIDRNITLPHDNIEQDSYRFSKGCLTAMILDAAIWAAVLYFVMMVW